MKKIILVFTLLMSITFITNAQEVTEIDTKRSKLTWKGSHLFGFGSHEGIVKIEKGQLLKSGNKISGGAFSIDMSTIAHSDVSYESELIKHLKSEDFFNVTEHPKASLVITKVKYHDHKNNPGSDKTYLRIEADLTIKAITHPIMLEAEIDKGGNTIAAKFKIDRTRWNINFGTKSTTASMKDSIISDAIEFEVELPLK